MGIKYCEFVDPKIIGLSHSEVDFDSEYWKKIKNNEQAETKKSKTYAYDISIFIHFINIFL